MGETIQASTVILGLVGLLQVIFLFLLSRIFSTQDKLFSVIENNKKECRAAMEKEKAANIALLEKHYATTGDLNTLEQELKGVLNNLSLEIRHLTEAIKKSFKEST